MSDVSLASRLGLGVATHPSLEYDLAQHSHRAVRLRRKPPGVQLRLAESGFALVQLQLHPVAM